MSNSAINKFALLVDEDDGDDVEALVSRLAVTAAAAAAKEALAAEEKNNNGRAPRNASSGDVRDERKGGRNYQQKYGGDYDQNYGGGYYQQEYENHGRRDVYQKNHGGRDGYQKISVERDGYQKNLGGRDGHQKNLAGPDDHHNNHVGRDGHLQNHGGRNGFQQKYEGDSSYNAVDGYSQGSGRGRNSGGGQGRGPYRGRVFNDNRGSVNGNQRSENVKQGFVRNNGVEKAGLKDGEDSGWYAARQFRGTNGGGRGRSGNNGGNVEYRVKAGGKNSDNSVTSNTPEAMEAINVDIAVNVNENGASTEQTVPENTEELAIKDKEKEEDARKKVERDARRKEEEEESKKMTLVEYEKLHLEKRKAMDSLKTDKREVILDKAFESMQIVNKKGEEVLPVKLKSEDKLKRKDSHYKEEKGRKVVHINEFLKHANGGDRRSAYGSRGVGGPGRFSGEREGRNRAVGIGGRGQVSGHSASCNPVVQTQVQIEDPRQFPGLEAVAKA